MKDLVTFLHEIKSAPYYDNKSMFNTLSNLGEFFRTSNINEMWYIQQFNDMFMHDGDIKTTVRARLTYSYLIQECLKYENDPLSYNENTELVDLFDIAIIKANKLIDTNKWLSEQELPLDFIEIQPVVKPKQSTVSSEPKGPTKLERAVALLKEHVGIKRDEFVSLLIDQLNMTAAGATTYWYNANKQLSHNKGE